VSHRRSPAGGSGERGSLRSNTELRDSLQIEEGTGIESGGEETGMICTETGEEDCVELSAEIGDTRAAKFVKVVFVCVGQCQVAEGGKDCRAQQRE